MLYQLMYKDAVVLEFDSATPNKHEVINATFLPVGIQNGMNLENWLRQRRADKSRISIRKLFAILKINFGRDKYISQFRRPTDFWWIRKKDSDDVFDMPIEDLHLLSLNLSPVVPRSPRTYEAANIGSYEKGWLRNGNELYKYGTVNEIFSELLYATISVDYLETAFYVLGSDVQMQTGSKNFIATHNFVNLESGEFLVLADEWTGTGAEEVFEDWFEKFNETLEKEELESLKIMHFLDVVLNNIDRHCQNFGFVYNENGTRRIAPNFDFNLSIIGYIGLEGINNNAIPVKSYFELFSEVPDAVKQIPSRELLTEYIELICLDMELKVESYLVLADWIINRWEQLV